MHALRYATHELNGLIRKPKGIIVLLLFIILWCAWMHIPMAWLYKKSLITPSLQSLSSELPSLTAAQVDGLARWPSFITAAIWYIGLFVFPAIPLLLSSDLMVSDLQRGTIRFFALRTTRRSFLLGRFLGQVLNLSVFILIAILLTIGFLKYWGSSVLEQEMWALSASGLNFLIISMPVLGLLTLASTFASTPRRAMLWAVLTWTVFGWIIGYITNAYPAMSYLHYLVPGHQLSDLISLYGLKSLTLAPIAIVQTLIFLLGADYLLGRGDL
jgi:ABC-type transport system involved in multi-copper enzyme maturation permease subunit